MNARLQARLLKPAPKPEPERQHSARADWSESSVCTQAQSILCGVRFRDGSTQCPPLTLAHARDVLAWASLSTAAPATPIPPTSGWRRFFFTARSKTV